MEGLVQSVVFRGLGGRLRGILRLDIIDTVVPS